MLEVNAYGAVRHKVMVLGGADIRMLGQDLEWDYAAHRLSEFAGSHGAVKLATRL